MQRTYAQMEKDNAIAASGLLAKQVIEGRFGKVTVDTDHAIYFASGLLGMPDKLFFCLTEFPGKNALDFKVLQCLNDHKLSFVVLPVPYDNRLIDAADMKECAEMLEVEKKNMGILLIASVHKSPDGSTKVSVNVRAPIIVDTEKKAAAQYVFTNNKYEIRHMLSAEPLSNNSKAAS